ncbi:MAG: hypothetical protein A3C93_05565 [Candidatus Lloydbacteria bacterium RIFCSPHIGHO2_02_FULL_54_17]|uniref:DUF5659 domain-containing protein n=1 Tax=Candidatus Lloydbacteria bacterium RIFCSPHIGHO2_02_FULL_54_17 TaxID=1798664 RepID=A0A1G2DAU9_9BACT|nr:MAG: hypothetical protein A3C93_05565 [Candidatus Lloydbacteria bacterium RIFCSPHIGHO2_02_FULL_54_17]OGZ13056.1 MAG: hypothetical protein A2948_03545 [Candidatus Lloydbacteria bacterium RIFCSPLOWO2_01_FULL_54_18]OGZ16504.1 MAG: hypothetical protein A3H76_04405 [Candidatus Lloydbacteria bacterium RIFCSPLOWO2_02_FULL_54_12]
MKDTEKISDLGLATLLLTLQFELVGLERADLKRINFLFHRTEGIEKVISDYWAGVEISVSVQSLFHTQKMLKSRLFAFK